MYFFFFKYTCCMPCPYRLWCKHSRILREKYTLLWMPDREDRCTTFSLNVGNRLPNHTASPLRNVCKKAVRIANLAQQNTNYGLLVYDFFSSPVILFTLQPNILICFFNFFYFECSVTCSNTTCLLSYLQLLYNVYQYLQLLLYTTLVWIL